MALKGLALFARAAIGSGDRRLSGGALGRRRPLAWEPGQGGGIPEQLAMRSGHETTSVFRRYNIVDEADLLRAANLIEDKRQSFCTDDAQYHAKPYDLRPNRGKRR